MRIVSYNVNALRARLSSPSRSLSAFLDSLDADIICLQETKMARHDLTADIAVAEGYESFFSFNRNAKKGGYSGVATFCRVGIVPSSASPILPLAADEGFTGLLHRSQTGDIEGGKGRVGCYEEIAKTDMSMQELLELDSEVLFNLYCPRVECGDVERLKFKLDFFKTLQRRLEALLSQNRRVIAIGDFNISPSAIDHCDPGPDFNKNICRRWFCSLLKHGGGAFWDVFRFLHPDRKEAYTCWSQTTGAEEFNYGTRIDLVLAAGSCNHEMVTQATFNETTHGFVECEVRECDILTQFKRIKPDNHPRWQGGRGLKLEGSDHAPIVVHLKEQSPIEPHEVPPLAARFMPEIRGRQQNLVALLKRQPFLNSNGIESKANGASASLFNITNSVVGKRKKQGTSASKVKKQGVHYVQNSNSQQKDLRAFFVSSSKAKISLADEDRSHSSSLASEQHCTESIDAVAESRTEFDLTNENVKWTIQDAEVSDSQGSYPAGSGVINGSDEQGSDQRERETDCWRSGEIDIEHLLRLEQIRAVEGTKQPIASWSRIKETMARAVPLCKGHDEPCVARVVKKQGPNIGRGFYVCARAEMGARIGCSISAANVCRVPWWKQALVFMKFAKLEEGERAACEERVMMACLAGSKETCNKYARDTCDPVFAGARIAESHVSLDPRFSDPTRQRMLGKATTLRDGNAFEEVNPDALLASGCREDSEPSETEFTKQTTNYRGRILMERESIQRSLDALDQSERTVEGGTSTETEAHMDEREGGLIKPKLDSQTKQSGDIGAPT